MRTLSAAIAFVLAIHGPTAAVASTLTALERQHLGAHLEMTESWLVEEVSGLSSAQLQFRRAPATWSILEVLEHLAIVEPIYWQNFRDAMKSAPASRQPATTDADILWYGIDRTRHDTAIATETPKGQLRDPRAALDALAKLHAKMKLYIRTTSDALRSHVVERQGCDAYQWLLMISTHEQRHVLQIREVKADTAFPRR